MTDRDRTELYSFTTTFINGVAWSTFFGAIAGLVVVLLAHWGGFKTPWQAGAVSGLVVMGWFGFMYYERWIGTTMPVQRYLTAPFTSSFQDDTLMETLPPIAQTPVLRNPDIFYDRICCTPEQFTWVAEHVESGMHLSVRNLRFKFPSSETAQAFQGALIRYGMLEWRQEGNPQGGLELTERGRALFHRRYLEMHPYPTDKLLDINDEPYTD